MKKILRYLLIFLGTTYLFCNGLSAETIYDQTGNLYKAWFDNGLKFEIDSDNKYVLHDSIGDNFNTTKIEISRGTAGIGFQIYTQFGNDTGDLGFVDIGNKKVGLADFFLDFGPGRTYGVDLSYNSTNGFFSSGLFSVGPDDYITSQMIFAGTQNLSFGGAFVDQNNNLKIPNVDFNTATSALIGDIGDIERFGNGNNYIYAFAISNSLLDLIGLNNQSSFDFMFGTAECANDVITGTSPIPEPSTMILFGLGLIGLSAAGRKKH
ncbi:MAG: hypothetical protein A2328_11155 [Bdellovibrionales bacterium RIFOXYB2_FULL_36_6]|nr:MAG: hypothetical protein A2328_11155 [Bdellovibrionales bacterium RIFOXYB2_FULL_36_6]